MYSHTLLHQLDISPQEIVSFSPVKASRVRVPLPSPPINFQRWCVCMSVSGRPFLNNRPGFFDMSNCVAQQELLAFNGLDTKSTHHHHYHHHHHHYYLSLNREDRWGTTNDFATSFLHFPLFSIVLWDSANSGPVLSLMLSSHLFLCLPRLLPPFTLPCKMVLASPDEWEI